MIQWLIRLCCRWVYHYLQYDKDLHLELTKQRREIFLEHDRSTRKWQ